jgi:lactoylglutathione lyase
MGLSMSDLHKPRAIGINHVALEVGDVDEALAFYGRLFEFSLRGRSEDMAFIDLGDQFIALQKGRDGRSAEGRHFGLVVDDREAARRALVEAGVDCLSGPFLDFRDPWGNRVEIVGYADIQFSKAPNVLRGMELTHLIKSAEAIKELTEKGMAPDSARRSGAMRVQPSGTEAANVSVTQFQKGMANLVSAVEEALAARGIEGPVVDQGVDGASDAKIRVSANGKVAEQRFAHQEIEDSGEAIDAPVAMKVRMLVSQFVG